MLRLIPEKFRAAHLALGPAAELDLQLGERKSGLSVEAVKAASDKITILLRLRLIIEDEVGVSVDFAADFNVSNESIPDFEVNEDVLKDTFIQVNAPAIAYPFLRAFVSTISVNSGYEQVLLPPVNFQALFDKKKGTSEVSTLITVR